jgi:hypothetical protein
LNASQSELPNKLLFHVMDGPTRVVLGVAKMFLYLRVFSNVEMVMLIQLLLRGFLEKILYSNFLIFIFKYVLKVFTLKFLGIN